ncbi:MAG: radical SAM protein [Lentisphaerae bacterium]|nr:radical SAM protein [Lentisphaerota bacterium]
MLQRLPGPLFVVVHVTLRCNRGCPDCYQQHDTFFNRHPGDMSLADFTTVLDNIMAFRLYRAHIHLMGGEPTFHPDFGAIVEAVHSRGASVTLTTNGSLLQKRAGSLLSPGVKEMNVSVPLDARGAVASDFLNSLDGYLAEGQAAGGRRPRLNLNLVISPATSPFIEKTVGFFRDRYPPGTFATFTLEHLEFERSARARMEVDRIDIESLRAQMERIRAGRWPFRVLWAPRIKPADYARYYRSDELFRHTCIVPWVGLAVYPDLAVTAGGAIFACNRILGSLKEQSLKQIWHSGRRRDFQAHLSSEGLPATCFRCCHKFYY